MSRRARWPLRGQVGGVEDSGQCGRWMLTVALLKQGRVYPIKWRTQWFECFKTIQN